MQMYIYVGGLGVWPLLLFRVLTFIALYGGAQELFTPSFHISTP